MGGNNVSQIVGALDMKSGWQVPRMGGRGSFDERKWGQVGLYLTVHFAELKRTLHFRYLHGLYICTGCKARIERCFLVVS